MNFLDDFGFRNSFQSLAGVARAGEQGADEKALLKAVGIQHPQGDAAWSPGLHLACLRLEHVRADAGCLWRVVSDQGEGEAAG